MKTTQSQRRLYLSERIQLGPNAISVKRRADGTEAVDVADCAIALSAGAATDEMDITVSVLDGAGKVIADVHNLEVWITDDAAALTLTGTSASGALTAVDGGILSVLTAKKHITCVTPATGIINLSLVDSANTAGEYVVVKLPSGRYAISAASVAGSYQGG